jgi:hypothetical protein
MVEHHHRVRHLIGRCVSKLRSHELLDLLDALLESSVNPAQLPG